MVVTWLKKSAPLHGTKMQEEGKLSGVDVQEEF